MGMKRRTIIGLVLSVVSMLGGTIAGGYALTGDSRRDFPADGKNLISENRKVELMEEQGIYRNAVDLDAMKVSAEQNRVGLILVGSAATCMMVLLAILYEKKRRMNRM